MKETKIFKNNEVLTNLAKETVERNKITGILTSQIRSKPTSDAPYYAFFRPDSANAKHSLVECEKQKCQDCEIPVIFRIKSSEIKHKNC